MHLQFWIEVKFLTSTFIIIKHNLRFWFMVYISTYPEKNLYTLVKFYQIIEQKTKIKILRLFFI